MSSSNSALESLSSADLLTATRDLIGKSCGVEAELLIHLSEIDHRKLPEPAAVAMPVAPPAAPAGPAVALLQPEQRRPVIRPLSEQTFQIQFTASRAFRDRCVTRRTFSGIGFRTGTSLPSSADHSTS